MFVLAWLVSGAQLFLLLLLCLFLSSSPVVYGRLAEQQGRGRSPEGVLRQQETTENKATRQDEDQPALGTTTKRKDEDDVDFLVEICNTNTNFPYRYKMHHTFTPQFGV